MMLMATVLVMTMMMHALAATSTTSSGPASSVTIIMDPVMGFDNLEISHKRSK